MDIIDYCWSIVLALGFTFVFLSYFFPFLINFTMAIT